MVGQQGKVTGPAAAPDEESKLEVTFTFEDGRDPLVIDLSPEELEFDDEDESIWDSGVAAQHVGSQQSQRWQQQSQQSQQSPTPQVSQQMPQRPQMPTPQTASVRGMAGGLGGQGLDTDAQGTRDSHTRRLGYATTIINKHHLQQPEDFIKYVTFELEGEQAGKLLASYLIHKQAALPFIQSFGSVEAFLSKQATNFGTVLPKYQRQLDIIKSALLEVPKLVQALNPQGVVSLDFGTPSAEPEVRLDFGGGAPAASAASSSARSSSAAGSSSQACPPTASSSARSDAYSLALPLRTAGVAANPQSRADIRDGAARLVREQRSLAAERAKQAQTPPSLLLRRGGERRGQLLGQQHLAEELERVQRRIRTQRLREDSDTEGEGEDGDGGEEGPDLSRADMWDPDEIGELYEGMQYEPPPCPHSELRGWCVSAVFATGDGLAWHDGFVFDTAVREGQQAGLCVRALFKDGFEDWWSDFPDLTFAFVSPSLVPHRVSESEVADARRRYN